MRTVSGYGKFTREWGGPLCPQANLNGIVVDRHDQELLLVAKERDHHGQEECILLVQTSSTKEGVKKILWILVIRPRLDLDSVIRLHLDEGIEAGQDSNDVMAVA